MEFHCAKWRTSSYSNANGGACVEVATVGNHWAVRDSKNRAGVVLTFDPDEWAAFVGALRCGEFD